MPQRIAVKLNCFLPGNCNACCLSRWNHSMSNSRKPNPAIVKPRVMDGS